MTTVSRNTELAVRVHKFHEALATILSLLAAAGIRLLARGIDADRRGNILLLLTDDTPRAKSVLEAEGYSCWLDDVLWVEYPQYRLGSAARLCQEIEHAHVAVERIYVSTVQSNRCFVVLKTSNNLAAYRHLSGHSLEDAA
jgi:hypothetical protein